MTLAAVPSGSCWRGRRDRAADMAFARSQVRRIVAPGQRSARSTARIDTGRLALRLRAAGSRGLVQETRRDLPARPRAALSCASLPAAPLRAHRRRERASRRCCSNLLENAAQVFARARADRRCGIEPGGRARAHRAVRDRGPGIRRRGPRADLRALFRAPARPRGQGGLGIGLYLCRAIAERHGGAMGVDSTPGQGATFWLDLASARPEPRSPEDDPIKGGSAEAVR